METVLSWKKLRDVGIDLDYYLDKTRSKNGYKIDKDRDKIINILLKHYPWLIVLQGYDIHKKPIYNLKLFIGYINAFLSRAGDSRERCKSLLENYEFNGKYQIIKN